MLLFTAPRDALLAPLQSVSGIVEKRHTLPILSNVLIEKKGDALTLLATDIEIQAREILTLRQRLNEILSKHTGQPIDRIERDTDRDNFLSAQEAADYGLIDKVLATRDAA